MIARIFPSMHIPLDAFSSGLFNVLTCVGYLAADEEAAGCRSHRACPVDMNYCFCAEPGGCLHIGVSESAVCFG